MPATKRKGAAASVGHVVVTPLKKNDTGRSPANASLATSVPSVPPTPTKIVDAASSLKCDVLKGGCGKLFSSARWLAKHHSKAAAAYI